MFRAIIDIFGDFFIFLSFFVSFFLSFFLSFSSFFFSQIATCWAIWFRGINSSVAAGDSKLRTKSARVERRRGIFLWREFHSNFGRYWSCDWFAKRSSEFDLNLLILCIVLLYCTFYVMLLFCWIVLLLFLLLLIVYRKKKPKKAKLIKLRSTNLRVVQLVAVAAVRAWTLVIFRNLVKRV